MVTRSKALLARGLDQGFTLIELLIVVLIVGILAAVAVPLYLGYVKDAKMVEGKSIAGALWTSVQANALAACGTSVNVTDAYARAGLDGNGLTADGRWKVTTAGTLTITCATGAYDSGDKFTLTAQAADISPMAVKLNYTVGNTPPAVLKCARDVSSYSNC